MAYRYTYRKKKGFFERYSLNTTLIFINVLIWIIIFLFIVLSGADLSSLEAINNSFIKYIALNSSFFFKGYVWTLFTSMFVHLSFSHLFVNMISMFFVGSFVERLIGRKRYLWLYLISGIVAGLFFVILTYAGLLVPWGERVFGGINIPAVGASGALFGLAGLLAVLVPRLKVLVMFIIPMPLWLGVFVLVFVVWVLSIIYGWPVGNTAHLGGLLVGVVYGFYLRKRYARKVRMLNKMFK